MVNIADEMNEKLEGFASLLTWCFLIAQDVRVLDDGRDVAASGEVRGTCRRRVAGPARLIEWMPVAQEHRQVECLDDAIAVQIRRTKQTVRVCAAAVCVA